jgi:Flp pilus assembly protein TadB
MCTLHRKAKHAKAEGRSTNSKKGEEEQREEAGHKSISNRMKNASHNLKSRGERWGILSLGHLFMLVLHFLIFVGKPLHFSSKQSIVRSTCDSSF